MDEALRQRLRIYIVCTILIATVLFAYWRAPRNGFVYDDFGYIVVNKPIHSGLTWSGLTWAFTTFYSGNWHPLTWVSHMIDCGQYRARPVGHHLTSVLLHLLNTLLLFAVLMAATRAPWRSAFVAVLFGVHPLHVESVAWISERKDVLSTLFCLLAIWSYIAYTRKPAVWKYALTTMLFVFGLMSKSMIVTLPALLLLMDYWPLGRMAEGKRGFWSLVWEKAPLFAISAGMGVLMFVAQHSGATVADLNQVPLTARLSNAVVACVAYLRKVFWPSDLVAFYPHPLVGLPWWQVAGACALLIATTVLALRRKAPGYALVGWLWYLITLLPVIGIVQIGGQSMADRYTYIPLIGIFVVIAWGAPDIIRGNRAVAILTAAAVLATMPLIVLTRKQVSYWKNDETLFAHAVKHTRDNWVASYSLGLALRDRGAWQRALPHARDAVRIQSYNPFSYILLGDVLLGLKRTDEAVIQLSEAVARGPNSAQTHAALARALSVQGNPIQALDEARIALEIDPQNYIARDVLKKAGKK